MITVAIDPGTHGCGLSVWDDVHLLAGMYTSGLGGQAHPLLEPIPHVREVFACLGRFDTLVIEIPQIYQQTSARKGDQADLINLAVTAGAIMHVASSFCSSILPLVPFSWKGNQEKISKKDGTIIMERHLRRTLSEEELQAVKLPKASSLHHNVWDGIGIGAYFVGRKPLRDDSRLED